MVRPPSQRRIHWLAYLWPGLPHLWGRGSWAGLVLAFGFALLLNLAVVSVLVWPELFPPRAKLAGAGTLALLWVAALWETRGELRRQAALAASDAEAPETVAIAQAQTEIDTLFAAAQTSYLAGEWAETERLLLDVLRRNADDTEAHLLLATLWRHTGRTTEAVRRLRRLANLDAATPWQFEISRELSRAAASGDKTPAEAA